MWAINPHIIIEIPPQGGSYAMVLVNDYEDEKGTPPSIDTETCEHCKGHTAVRKSHNEFMSCKELCESSGECLATVDWDKVYSRD